MVSKFGSLTLLEPSGPAQACNGIAFIVTALSEAENGNYEGWKFNSGNYLFTTDTK